MLTKVITMAHYRRPAYTKAVMDGLAKCQGIGEYLILPCVEPGNDEVRNIVSNVTFAECRPIFNQKRLGLGSNTFQALKRGFNVSDYVIHLEDDVVPGPDALAFFEFCNERYGKDTGVMDVCAWNRKKIADPAEIFVVERRSWFVPWGWATWANRWSEMARKWRFADDWDSNMVHIIRGGRVEVYPRLSRVDNIGAENGQHVRSAEWHKMNHAALSWTGDQNWRDAMLKNHRCWR